MPSSKYKKVEYAVSQSPPQKNTETAETVILWLQYATIHPSIHPVSPGYLVIISQPLLSTIMPVGEQFCACSSNYAETSMCFYIYIYICVCMCLDHFPRVSLWIFNVHVSLPQDTLFPWQKRVVDPGESGDPCEVDLFVVGLSAELWLFRSNALSVVESRRVSICQTEHRLLGQLLLPWASRWGLRDHVSVINR